ncbi:MAG: HD domain-containing protein [Chloroflexi bacterium]|nr:HD domain-containing protein [Chloroflexota bacterium]
MSHSFITLEQARAFYTDADSAHDFEHVLRVTRMAEHLAGVEGADVEIVCAAALLHDIARHDEDSAAKSGQPPGGAHTDHADVSAREAKLFLVQNGADETFAERVADAIRSHRFRGAAKPQTLEAKILFDADKLDSIGAIGIARAYAVCGLLNQKLYSAPKPDAIATRLQHNNSHTPVDEFHVKLKHLRERFYTPTARRIATERHAYMVAFFERLEREVQGES